MSFNRLARHYSWLEWLLAGRKLQRCRTAFLREALDAESILLVGEGHGRFLLELCRAASASGKRIVYLDASAEMLRVAKERVERSGVSSGSIEFHHSPILEFQPRRKVDLIVTQFFLDCFEGEELSQVVRALASWLSPGGKWIVADFQVPSQGWQKLRARLVLKLAYSFFRFATALPARQIIAPKPFLTQNGLALEARREFNFGLLYAELWAKPR